MHSWEWRVGGLSKKEKNSWTRQQCQQPADGEGVEVEESIRGINGNEKKYNKIWTMKIKKPVHPVFPYLVLSPIVPQDASSVLQRASSPTGRANQDSQAGEWRKEKAPCLRKHNSSISKCNRLSRLTSNRLSRWSILACYFCPFLLNSCTVIYFMKDQVPTNITLYNPPLGILPPNLGFIHLLII